MECYTQSEYCRLLDFLKKDGFNVKDMADYIQYPYHPLAEYRNACRNRPYFDFWVITDAPFEDMPLYINYQYSAVAYWRISVGR